MANKKQYYVEIMETESDIPYVIESDWFDTKKEAKEWASKLANFDGFSVTIMTAVFNGDKGYDII